MERAAAFIGHNRDRLSITPTQMYFSALAAGEEIATAVREACDKAGAAIRRSVPQTENWKVGETAAVKSISIVVAKKGVAGGARLLSYLVRAKRAPISAAEIKALANILFDEPLKSEDAKQLDKVLVDMPAEDWLQMASQRSAQTKIPLYKALAALWSERAIQLSKAATSGPDPIVYLKAIGITASKDVDSYMVEGRRYSADEFDKYIKV